jgi:hypothetical protein
MSNDKNLRGYERQGHLQVIPSQVYCHISARKALPLSKTLADKNIFGFTPAELWLATRKCNAALLGGGYQRQQ